LACLVAGVVCGQCCCCYGTFLPSMRDIIGTNIHE
jgi:hypothetical protein